MHGGITRLREARHIFGLRPTRGKHYLRAVNLSGCEKRNTTADHLTI